MAVWAAAFICAGSGWLEKEVFVGEKGRAYAVPAASRLGCRPCLRLAIAHQVEFGAGCATQEATRTGCFAQGSSCWSFVDCLAGAFFGPSATFLPVSKSASEAPDRR